MPSDGPLETRHLANPLSPSSPETIRNKKLLLGEGREEFFFFSALLEHLKIADVQVESYGGKDNLRNFLATLILRPGFSNLLTVAVTRDADASPRAAFESVCTTLTRASFDKPAAHGQFSVGQPRVGVFILPDGHKAGALEDLCLDSVSTDVGMPCVDEFLRCVDQAGRKPANVAKARVHAWLASQIKPDRRLGEAAKAGYWNWSAEAFSAVREFINLI